jgi:tetratricopeptide (TPR) repeat protein
MTAEARRAEQEENPDSVDLYIQGVQWFNKAGFDNIERARGFFERAVALDPTNIDALVGAARSDVIVGAIFTNHERAERLAAAEALLIKGLSIAPRNYWAHLWLGYVLILTNRAARGIGELERASALNRNLGAPHAWTGLAKITMGRAEEAASHINEALRLSPTDSFAFMWTHLLGLAKFHLGTDEEAAALFRRSIDASRNYPLNHFYMAAALAHLGRLEEARAESKAGLTLAPNYSITRFRKATESDNPTYLAQRERIIEGLRKAGVAEE